MGGLAAEITEKEFGDYFAKFGVVKVNIYIYKDQYILFFGGRLITYG